MTTQRRAAALLALLVGALALAGCSRTIDPVAAGGTPVPGFPGLYRTCDGPTLIYFYSASDGRPDGIESMFYGVPECTGDPQGEAIPGGQG
jgi:hypothetical protein